MEPLSCYITSTLFSTPQFFKGTFNKVVLDTQNDSMV